MQTLSEDPLDWTVDEVVYFLCHNPETPWSHSTSQPPRPNPIEFEAILRENMINGEVLLQDVDKDTLRDDLGLKRVGPRSCIMNAIRYLQQISPKYQQHYPQFIHTKGDLSLNLTAPASTNPPYSPLRASNLSLTKGIAAETSKISASATDNSVGSRSVSQIVSNTPSSEQRVGILDSVRLRPQEHAIIDDQGRKRRRLNPIALSKAHDENQGIEYLQNSTPAKTWYMGSQTLTPAEIFYPSLPAKDEREFTLVFPKLPSAQCCFVNKRLIHFFHQVPVKANSDQDKQWALVPYPPSVVATETECFLTLYTENDGKVIVSKENIADWPQFNPQQKKGDVFSHLLDKYPPQDSQEDALPLYGDSGSEGAFDDETWREIDDEHMEPRSSKKAKLGPLEIESIMQSCVSDFEDKWRRLNQPKEEHKARRLWLSVKRVNCANQETKAITNEIIRLEKCLRKFQKAIRENEYTSQAELCAQCRSLEETVYSIQKQKWRLSVLKLEACPPKLPAPPKREYMPRPRQADEESLHSESDNASIPSLDSFIDDFGINPVFEQMNSPERPTSPYSSQSDGDDDIISVSGIRRRLRPQRHPFFATSSSSPSPPVSDNLEVIDLTMESPEPDDFTIETPPLNPVQPEKPGIFAGRSHSISPAPSLGQDKGIDAVIKTNSSPPQSIPEPGDMGGILLLPWALLEERQDRRRLLAKLIGSLSYEERRKIKEKVNRHPRDQIFNFTRKALKALRKGKHVIPDMIPSQSDIVMRIASFYISWVNCVHLRAKGIQKRLVVRTQQEADNFDPFFAELLERLDSCEAWEQQKGLRNSPAPGQVDPANTPHKKRKREVKESQEVKLNQENALLRVAFQDRQRERLEKRLETMGLSNNNPNHQAVSFGDPVIYLDPHIGRRVKPHQLKGIQFMWRELIEDKNRQGCLLAHTMGLGKTMQVISLLVAISAAAASDNPKIKQQVPEAFHRSQTLILCPPSLIENWYEEFLMWTPKNSSIGRVRPILGGTVDVRLQEVSDWNIEGGVLIMSYNLFQKWIQNKESKKGRCFSDVDHQNVKNWLLEGPNIIVADEAHRIKNPSAAVTAAAKQFRSKSRIALTGSPLANSLSEYYAMVNWIAEGYLGDYVQFKANYIEPIEEGLYTNSTYHERRRALMKLQVVKQNLAPKIDRADISVLEGSLPPKVEFVITVPLTQLQKLVYDCYVASVLEGNPEDAGNAHLWTWLEHLALCCNHPACFRDKLLSRVNDTVTHNRNLEEPEPTIPGDEPITQAGILNLESLVSKQERLFANIPDMTALDLSARTRILNRIIDESIKAGDKILVFSQSIPTLNYIEQVFQISNRKYCRLDGQTKMASRQDAIKRFNRGSEQRIYLISTRAGGQGLNIPGANRVIIFDFSWNPVWEEQAVGRAYRLGQQKQVYVYRFLAGGTYQEIIHNKTVYKTQLAFHVVDKKNPISKADKQLKDYIFPAKVVKQEDVTEFIGKDPDVLGKIIAEEAGNEERLIRNITLTQTFEKESNDKLTEDEQKDVQQALNEEILRRTDPNAYEKLLAERLRQPPYIPSQHVQSPASFQPTPTPTPAYQPPIPASAHNFAPPALAPDVSITQRATLNSSSVGTNSVHMPVTVAQAPIQSLSQNQPSARASKSNSPPPTCSTSVSEKAAGAENSNDTTTIGTGQSPSKISQLGTGDGIQCRSQ